MSATPRRDAVLAGFLRRQRQEGEALARESDLLAVDPLGDRQAPDRYLARFSCRGLVRPRGGEVAVGERFEVGIWFPPDYLRRADPYQVLTWLGPPDVFHPNVSDRLPFVCVGRLVPGTPLVDLLYQCFEIVTWRKVTMRENDALNAAACAWARERWDRQPVDPRPLKRRRLDLRVETPAGGAA